MLKKIIAPFLGFGLLASPVLAKEPAAKVRDADPALWVVKDHDTTIYLFGTFHALTPDLGWFDDAVRDAFGAAPERIAGFIFIGTAQRELSERPRPDFESIASRWTS